MKYRLTIEQFTDNPEYEQQMAKYREASRAYAYINSDSGIAQPQIERVIKVLTVEVTDVEFAAIKKAALATMA